jgi:hypothetical protein
MERNMRVRFLILTGLMPIALAASTAIVAQEAPPAADPPAMPKAPDVAPPTMPETPPATPPAPDATVPPVAAPAPDAAPTMAPTVSAPPPAAAESYPMCSATVVDQCTQNGKSRSGLKMRRKARR